MFHLRSAALQNRLKTAEHGLILGQFQFFPACRYRPLTSSITGAFCSPSRRRRQRADTHEARADWVPPRDCSLQVRDSSDDVAQPVWSFWMEDETKGPTLWPGLISAGPAIQHLHQDDHGARQPGSSVRTSRCFRPELGSRWLTPGACCSRPPVHTCARGAAFELLRELLQSGVCGSLPLRDIVERVTACFLLRTARADAPRLIYLAMAIRSPSASFSEPAMAPPVPAPASHAQRVNPDQCSASRGTMSRIAAATTHIAEPCARQTPG